MTKNRNYLIIMLVVICFLFTGCQKGKDNVESTKVNDEQTQEIQTNEEISLIGEPNKQGNSISTRVC